jgi:hypothetical protein
MPSGLQHRPTCSELIQTRVAVAPHATWQDLNSQPGGKRVSIGTIGGGLKEVTPSKQGMPNGVHGR